MKTNKPALEAVISEAQQAFFAVIAKSFPTIKSGDFSPLAQHNFDVACSIAVQQWIEENKGE